MENLAWICVIFDWEMAWRDPSGKQMVDRTIWFESRGWASRDLPFRRPDWEISKNFSKPKSVRLLRALYLSRQPSHEVETWTARPHG